MTTVEVTSIMPAEPALVWEHLQENGTVQETTEPVEEGILLERVVLYVSEPQVPAGATAFNHEVVLEPAPSGEKLYTHYTDKIELDAGWRTPFVAWRVRKACSRHQHELMRTLLEKPIVTTYFAGKIMD